MSADPSRAARAALAARAADSAAAVGSLARLVSKAASSPALQSSIVAFAEHEITLESTDDMLHKINEGMVSIDEAVEDMSRSLDASVVEATVATPAYGLQIHCNDPT